MRKFKNLFEEPAADYKRKVDDEDEVKDIKPRSSGEQKFKDMHKVNKVGHPVAPDEQHTGDRPKGKKGKAGADHKGADEKGEPILKTYKDFTSKIKEEVELDEGKMKNTTMQANKPRFERKGQELEAYANKFGGVDKKDMMKVAAMLKRGDKSGALKYAKTLDTDPKEYIMSLIGEETELDEAKMSASQIAALKKAYEPMRGKKISMDSGKKLSAIMDKVDDDKQALIQLVKADIPFVSSSAVTRLISKHGMKGAEINKLKEEVELDEATYSYKAATFNGNVVKGTGKTKEAARKDAENKAKELGSTIRKRLPEETNLDEAFKAGTIRLKDGKTVKIDKMTAESLNNVMKQLNSTNRKRMETEAMKDKDSFDTMAKFAKAAV
jgi:hypothetical protein